MNKKKLHKELWKRFFKEKNPTQEELWEIHIAYEPEYQCKECGLLGDVKCSYCGGKKFVLVQTREDFEIKLLSDLLKLEQL